MTPALHAITLTAPWGILCVAPVIDNAPLEAAFGYSAVIGQPLKVHETRGYRLSAPPRRLAIHNGKGDAGMREGITERILRGWRFVQPYAAALLACGYSDLDPWQSHYEEMVKDQGLQPIRLGAMQGLVTVPYVISTTDSVRGPAHAVDRELGHWAPGRFAWRMETPWVLPKPFHVRGMQSVWRVPEHVQQLMREQGATL